MSIFKPNPNFQQNAHLNMQQNMPQTRSQSRSSQNVPRGTFSNFGGRPPQNHPQKQNQQIRPQQPMRQQQGYPQQARQQSHRQQGHQPQAVQHNPNVHPLNPQGDPFVRFEPVPEGFLPPGKQSIPQAIPTAEPEEARAHPIAEPLSARPPQTEDRKAEHSAEQSPNSPQTFLETLKEFLHGESNGLLYYERLSGVTGIIDEHLKHILKILEHRRRGMQDLSEIYRAITAEEWVAPETKIQNASSFKHGISYAILQEARLLREAAGIYANLKNENHLKTMASVLYSKMADIICLMSI